MPALRTIFVRSALALCEDHVSLTAAARLHVNAYQAAGIGCDFIATQIGARGYTDRALLPGPATRADTEGGTPGPSGTALELTEQEGNIGMPDVQETPDVRGKHQDPEGGLDSVCLHRC